MKFTPLDYILNGLLMSLIGLCAYALASWSSAISALGSYHVIVSVAVFLIAYGVLSAFSIRLLLHIRPLRLGEFDVSHPNFVYWKVLMVVFDMGRFALNPFTTMPLRPLIAKLYGATIGKNVAIGGTIEDAHLITIGDGVVIGNQSLISGNMTMNGKILFGRVSIGNCVTIGANSVIMPNVEIGDNVLLGVGSVVLPGTRIPQGESWRGNPARKWQ